MLYYYFVVAATPVGCRCILYNIIFFHRNILYGIVAAREETNSIKINRMIYKLKLVSAVLPAATTTNDVASDSAASS